MLPWNYVDTRSNAVESLVEYFLIDGTLDHRYARVILLSKEWWSEEVVAVTP
jgi:hypothetical protein